MCPWRTVKTVHHPVVVSAGVLLSASLDPAARRGGVDWRASRRSKGEGVHFPSCTLHLTDGEDEIQTCADKHKHSTTMFSRCLHLLGYPYRLLVTRQRRSICWSCSSHRDSQSRMLMTGCQSKTWPSGRPETSSMLQCGNVAQSFSIAPFASLEMPP
jgi:hypothetical protein